MTLTAELQQIERLHNAEANFLKTLALLRALKTGEVSLDCIAVGDARWDLQQPAPTPAAVPDLKVVEPEPPTPDVPAETSQNQG